MNERPTPETDQFKVKLKTTCGEKYWVPVEHSERLERERDEARELAQAFHNDQVTLLLERDEAREATAATKHYLTKERDDALFQIVQAECRAERFCQERDEARNKMADALQEVDLRTLDYLRFREAIIATLEENRHLADVDDCTLAKLKSVVPDWK